MTTDYYELLGISTDANDEEIRRAYRKLARQHHPDANGGDPEAEAKFKEISVAYETLRDPQKRRRYDTFGPEGMVGGEADGFGIGDIFETFFGTGDPFGRRRSSRPAGPASGPDAEVHVELEFVEAALGTTVPLEVELLGGCERCGAAGCQPGTHPSTCRTCQGSGEVRQVRRSLLGQMVTAHPCQACQGTGTEIMDRCSACRGTGRVPSRRQIDVEVPAGIADGQKLRLGGRGSMGLRGGPAGDLYVGIQVREHEKLQRQGDDVIQTISLSISQAALGTQVTVESLEGPEDLEVPAGTQPGRVFRLRGRGIPSLRNHRRGDLLAEVVVQIPERLSREEEELMRRLAEIRSEEVAPPDGGLFSKIRSAFP